MKLIFERDIAAFHGKDWQKRAELRKKAWDADKRLRWRSFWLSVQYGLLPVSLMVLRQREIIPSLGWVLVLSMAIGIPLAILARALWVNPLIKAALESSPK